MALGVLNNLSAIYAEHNLNNTNTSLQTVLQQLSSGSKINSGADDAAGLSLINGLAANSTALTQSATNATEGVGLLEVADGALSQVTNLLNRAITLATEASNGTLNSAQGSAANQEYQSILAEINNIGSTTTYNQQQVFSGKNVAIYTGDSSTKGSSIDNLNIRQLSASSVGDRNGVMSYSSGQNNVFIDLSKSGVNASASDSLSGTSTTISVNYLSSGSNGASIASTAQITVGAGTNYSNTAQGLINAINNAGLGLTASFTTAGQAGTAAISSALGASSDTGILISGQGIGAGSKPGVVGTLSVTGAASNPGDILGGSLTIGTQTISLGTANTTDTLANLQNTINAGNYGVTASLSGGVLTFTSSNPTIAISSTGLVDQSSSNVLGTFSDSLLGDTLSGTFKIMDSSGTTRSFAITGANNTMATLATYITAQGWGINASYSAATGTMTFTSTTSGSLANFNASDILALSGASGTLSVTSGSGQLSLGNVPTPQSQMTTSPGTIGTLNIGGAGTAADTLGGTMSLVGADGITHTFALSAANSNDTLPLLTSYINSLNIGVTATQSGTALTLASTTADSRASFNAASIAGIIDNTAGSTLNVSNVFAPPAAYYSIGISGTIMDSSTGGGTSQIAMTTDSDGSSGIASISYSDSAGQSLTGTDLLSQNNAQAALTALNSAISDVASMDGYIGAQINTLNSISQVMSTQQENVVSAQNAIQATDYAAATSNMSKYEILSQTGIAALAQANSIQQEVTKLLQ